MKKLSEVDTATVSEATFMTNLKPGPNVTSGISSAMITSYSSLMRILLTQFV